MLGAVHIDQDRIERCIDDVAVNFIRAIANDMLVRHNGTTVHVIIHDALVRTIGIEGVEIIVRTFRGEPCTNERRVNFVVLTRGE